MTELEELRQEATELGVSFGKTMGVAQLKEKIEKFYESKENDSPSIESLVKEKETKSTSEVQLTKQERLNLKIQKQKTDAMKTRIVTIVDNDQRINNLTTTCTVTCANEYFDLGTKIIPLNEKVEVRQGHIDVLKEVKIPQHIKGKDGLASVRMRNRYSVSYED